MKNQNQSQTIMGVLAYLGVLIVIPFLLSNNDPFVKFHLKQGSVLFIIEIVLWLGMRMFWPFMPLVGVLQFCVLILAIIGIINVLQNKEKDLPVVGSFAHKIKI